MNILESRRLSHGKQYIISLLFLATTAILCTFLVDYIGYRAIALLLLLVVSINAIFFDIFPVLLSALLSALVWNFFFIPPTFTLQVDSAEDGLFLLMYFVIATINAVMTHTIRDAEKKQVILLEKANSIKLYNTLFNSLSHELKTPIATIIGAIDTIKENNGRLSNSNLNELYNEIELASFRLHRQVENLLNISRLEAGYIQPKKEWCDVNEIVYSCLKTIGDATKDHIIEFNPNEKIPMCKLDFGLVQQILLNLLYNAIQYTPENSTIVIDLSNTKEKCIIQVSDEGPGFLPNEIENVFNKFYRINQSVAGGTGLGLSIVKGFAEAQGGRVILINLPQGGARFTVEIPCEQMEIDR